MYWKVNFFGWSKIIYLESLLYKTNTDQSAVSWYIFEFQIIRFQFRFEQLCSMSKVIKKQEGQHS